MNSYTLLHAMSGICETYVLEAQRFLGYGEKMPRKRKANRRLWTTILIAAVIVSLFTVTAYAMGLFGLRERTIEAEFPEIDNGLAAPGEPEPTPKQKRWVSLNGYENSPEYLANREWLIFEYEYLASATVSDDDSWREELSEEDYNSSVYYSTYDVTMFEKLCSIAEKYDLSLHTHRIFPVDLEAFYRAAGTGEFLVQGSGTGYIYEDGAFHLVCPLDQNGNYLVINKNIAGKIIPYASAIGDEANYDVWEYTNIYGDTVLMAYCVNEDDMFQAARGELRIYYDKDDVFIEVNVKDRSDYLVSGRESCEKTADMLIFSELLKTDVDLDAAIHEPQEVEAPGDAATLADFIASPEGMAAREYSQAARGRIGTEAGIQELEALRPGIAEKYGLQDYDQYWEVGSQEHIDSGMFYDSPFPAINYDEFEAMGNNRQIAEMFYMLGLYDNGVIIGNKHLQYSYIPFGSLCAKQFGLTEESYTDEWFYQTSCGAVVMLCGNFRDRSYLPSTLIYRTANGWLIGVASARDTTELEAWADEIDYTVFP